MAAARMPGEIRCESGIARYLGIARIPPKPVEQEKANTMNEKTFNVLFLCTGNSARSIMAEVLLNQMGRGRFKCYSAGSYPAGQVNPHAIEMLKSNRLPTEELRSKSWDEFARPDARPLDFVFTVCDNDAGEVCPIWPGQPMTAHWGIEDPAVAKGDDQTVRKAFFKAYNQLHHRLSIFVSLPMDKLDRLTLQRRLDEIGKVRD
jgi:arsenate reductase (thioredoxin)